MKNKSIVLKKCPICNRRVKVVYLNEIITFRIVDTKKSDTYYPCCSEECFNKFMKKS